MPIRRLQKYEGPAEKFAFAQKLPKCLFLADSGARQLVRGRKFLSRYFIFFAICERVLIEEPLIGCIL